MTTLVADALAKDPGKAPKLGWKPADEIPTADTTHNLPQVANANRLLGRRATGLAWGNQAAPAARNQVLFVSSGAMEVSMDEVLLDVAIGLAVLFLGVAAAIGAFLEGVSRVLGWRAGHLWTWMRKAVGGDSPRNLDWFFSPLRPEGSPSGNSQPDRLEANVRRGSPRKQKRINSIPPKDFARALVATLIPEASGETSLASIKEAVNNLDEKVPLRGPLLHLLREANEDWTKFTDRVGEWFDEQMQDLTALYRQNIRVISATIALLLALLLNINAIDAFAVLNSDAALRAAGVEAAQAINTECKDSSPGRLNTCVETGAKSLFSSTELVEPLGLFDNDDRGRRFQKTPWAPFGILLSAVLISLGAPFWRDAVRSLTARRRPSG